jgi:hypothetical protein
VSLTTADAIEYTSFLYNKVAFLGDTIKGTLYIGAWKVEFIVNVEFLSSVVNQTHVRGVSRLLVSNCKINRCEMYVKPRA